MEAKPNSRSEDRIWAALAHGSALFPVMGPIIPVIIWFTQRKRSEFARFHALQAMGYQMLSFWLWIGVGPILMILFFIVLVVVLAVASARSSNAESVALLFPFAFWALFLGVFGLYIAVGLIGAVASLQGRNFRYPLLGNWMARFLEYSSSDHMPLSEEKEDRFVAAICHSTCIFLIWGIGTPLTLWITQKDRSSRLRFQALQAAVYQAVGAVGYFAVTALIMIASFAMFPIMMTSDLSRHSQSNPTAMMLVLIPVLCAEIVLLIAVPLYHLFGFIASIRVLHGRDYRYPVIGGFLARRMGREPRAALEETR